MSKRNLTIVSQPNPEEDRQRAFDCLFHKYAFTLASVISPNADNSMFSNQNQDRITGVYGSKEFEDFCREIMIDGLIGAAKTALDEKSIRAVRDRLGNDSKAINRVRSMCLGYYTGDSTKLAEATLRVAPLLRAAMPMLMVEPGWPKKLSDERKSITLQELALGMYRPEQPKASTLILPPTYTA